MIKLMGAVVILIATTWTGFEASRHLNERPRQLRQLKSALQTLEAEIMFGHTPLHEAARRLASQTPKPLSWFFEVFANKLTKCETTVKAAWDESLQETWKLTAFKRGELEIMKQFGETLGRHDRISQQKQIMLTLSHLEREEMDARDKQIKYEKMVKSLGFLSGLLIIILLM
ncbi:stage III sporulation protein SpoAB [Bacillus aquiflavi]|uniref:Stage III sporulation protein SpoAB n=1 Tax=Bacillus aquiflavi TaxID=2672567 RepID=A0A6B3VX95_9BACI|nr:stage III sporulation protein SpoIIIAB [Bacillus aquiflavi]MBA4535780.1 stage III sporulation protein SpoAB [Bacillus aquiflavi]NEY80156.1 stage III sporulation protein SpoAB [Bacillus aquiflavi]UAC47210.1 stage III sporulation protein SpoAB [Bacillus aquiflavi]